VQDFATGATHNVDDNASRSNGCYRSLDRLLRSCGVKGDIDSLTSRTVSAAFCYDIVLERVVDNVGPELLCEGRALSRRLRDGDPCALCLGYIELRSSSGHGTVPTCETPTNLQNLDDETADRSRTCDPSN
jgi:hypothetical protein